MMRYLIIFVGVVIVAASFGVKFDAPKYTASVKGILISKEQKEETLQLTFGGDIMLDRYIRQVMERNSGKYIFSCLNNTLKQPDMMIANLEGPITNFPSKSVGSIPGGENNFTFTFATSTAELLKENGFDVLNIGNNHSKDFGDDGVAETVKYLKNADIGFFGDAISNNTYRVERNGIKLEFITYNQFFGSLDKTIGQIKAARFAGFLPVVYTHWGEEYQTDQPKLQEIGHALIDAGAEIVIGSHPHVVGQVEEYEGKKIFYSLGNFIFDQYFSEEVRTGLLLKVEISKNGILKYEEIPVELLRDGRTCRKEL
jgi:poly-gamma-glutamate synthesis protein (capsule biosynthesis protein)